MANWQHFELLAGIGINVVVSVVGFVKLAVNYEHRFTKLETEVMMLLAMIQNGKIRKGSEEQ